jgi:hypothetical protein
VSSGLAGPHSDSTDSRGRSTSQPERMLTVCDNPEPDDNTEHAQETHARHGPVLHSCPLLSGSVTTVSTRTVPPPGARMKTQRLAVHIPTFRTTASSRTAHGAGRATGVYYHARTHRRECIPTPRYTSSAIPSLVPDAQHAAGQGTSGCPLMHRQSQAPLSLVARIETRSHRRRVTRQPPKA